MPMTRVDWIDYRASVARAQRREQKGDKAVTCPGCGTETDVTDVVHSPRCSHLAAGARPAPVPTEGEIMPENVVCKVDGCGGDASSAPTRGATSRLCETHRQERSQQMSAARVGKPRGKKTTATARTAAANGNGSVVAKAARLLAAAEAVEEIETQLEQARAELKQAAAAIA